MNIVIYITDDLCEVIISTIILISDGDLKKKKKERERKKRHPYM